MWDIIFVVCLLGGFLVPAWIYKQKWLFITFSVFFVIFGAVELIAINKTGMTVSAHFWAFSDANPAGGWIVLGGMGLGWLALIVHFAWRHLIRGK